LGKRTFYGDGTKQWPRSNGKNNGISNLKNRVKNKVKNKVKSNINCDGQECPSHTVLSGCEVIVGYYGAFDADNQSHRDAFRFVVVCLVQKVDGAEASAEAQGRSSGLSANAARDKGTHDGIGFAVTLLEAALSGESVGGNQAGKNSGIDLGFECPKTMLAGRIGNRRTGRYKVLCRRGGGQ
jgi:hypothetical protein